MSFDHTESAGLVPLEYMQLFGDELRRMYPNREIRLWSWLDAEEPMAELLVSPPLSGIGLWVWRRRYVELCHGLGIPPIDS